MHQIGCVTEDHTTNNRAKVDCCLNISYFEALVFERISSKDNRNPEKENVNTQLCAEETGCVQCNSGHCPGLQEADTTVHFLTDETLFELITHLNLFLLCLDTAIFLMLMKLFIKFWLRRYFKESFLFCVLLNIDADNCRIRDKEEP